MRLLDEIIESIRSGGPLTIERSVLEPHVDMDLLKYLDLEIDPLGDLIRVESSGMKAVIYIILGGDPENVAQHVDWRSFESLVAAYLKLYGYEVARNIRAPPPKGFEIDILAVDVLKKVSIIIDCKHWKINRLSQLYRAIDDLILRIDRSRSRCFILTRTLPKFREARYIYPAIVTLRSGDYVAIEKIPIIPIYKLSDFLNNIDLYLEELEAVKFGNPCYRI